MLRTALARLGFLLAAPVAFAQQDDSTRGEVWPELDVYWKLGSSMKAFGLVSLSSARNENYSEGQYGIHWDISWKAKFRPQLLGRLTARSGDEKLRPVTFRVGYRYSGSISDESFREDRCVAELHLRWPLVGGILLSDRNRVDMRWLSAGYSTRYRNRLLLERETGIGGYALTPYASAEIYYDSRYHAWTRRRYLIGVQAPLHPRAMLDTYYSRQNDDVSTPAHVNALGFALNLFF